jgi:5-(carboxyamino)imidazole ribonucleotide mutase
VIPVIGVPMLTKSLGGMDSLLSTAQMPKGIPVATVAIDGSQNAGLLVVAMLAITDEGLAKQLADYRTEIAG